MSAVLDNKLGVLRDELRRLGRVVVAFSGGADSAFLAAVATDTLGASATLAVTAVSPSLAASEHDDCRRLSDEWGLRWRTVETEEMERAAYRINDRNRCYSRLQGRMQNARPSAALVATQPVIYYLFDLLWLDGRDLTALPLTERKDRLREAIAFADPLRYSDHLEEDGELALRAACEQGLEGLIAKRATSPYVAGRSREWLKFKCVLEQEFVVLGWTDPQRSRTGIGALLVGYHEGGELRFAGKVGTGFDHRELDRLSAKLTRIERKTSPLPDTTGVQKTGVHWARPELVAQVGFGEWTPDGKLRHPRYLGLRDDKAPTDVVRER